MLNHFVEYEIATGEIVFRGGLDADAMAAHRPAPGNAVLVVPYAALMKPGELDLNILKPWCLTRVDQQAEAFRLMFITGGSGQALTYSIKRDEALAHTANADADTPFLSAEAQARGASVEDVAVEVLAQNAIWTVMGSRIEAARMGAKAAISAATDAAGVLRAVYVDWSALAA